MSIPTPIESLIGGMGISLAAHELLLLNGSVFGISGFLHRAVRGSMEGLAGAAGLVLGGVLVAQFEGVGPSAAPLSVSKMALSGFLVGLGTKLANGCTSGHMICGISRFSVRSIAATATFFLAGVLTTLALHGDQSPVAPANWTLGLSGAKFLALQLVPFGVSAVLYALKNRQADKTDKTDKKTTPTPPPRKSLRILASLATSVQFGLALRLSNLSEASRVLSFLVLPFNRGFDPSLAFVAAGGLSLGIFLYRYARGNEQPRLGGAWSIPKGGVIDARLLIGSTIFGVGWGMAGICPGPALVNLGRALGSGGQSLSPYAMWLSSMLAVTFLVAIIGLVMEEEDLA